MPFELKQSKRSGRSARKHKTVRRNEQSSEQDCSALSLALRLLGMPVDPAQIFHRLGRPKEMGEIEIYAPPRRWSQGEGAQDQRRAPADRAAAGARFFPEQGLGRRGKVTPALAIIQGGGDPGPKTLSIAEFTEAWNGRLVLLSKRAALGDFARRFDLTWFWGAISKYRSVLYEVLAASFVIQLFGLATPLIFQTVIDKVLVHRGLSTLEILVAGLALISIFDVILSGLRTYLFSHTSNRIDVELGSRVFRHLMALPLPYFEARRVGDSVARVRELETIRQFITGSSITLVLDLMFCAVFIGVMFIYSSLLAWIVVATLPLYAILSVAVTPLFRVRLEEKFHHGAINQAFLVESVTGVETVKAMAVEPLMQKKWEEQLASYVGLPSARPCSAMPRRRRASPEQADHGDHAVRRRRPHHQERTDGRRTGRVQHAVFAGKHAGPAARPGLAGFPSGADFDSPAGRHPQHAGRNTPRTPPSARTLDGAVEFEHVQFRYGPGERPALREVSFKIEPGQVIGIVGPSGSGKSTIAKVIQRLYIPESGRVLIDGADIRALIPLGSAARSASCCRKMFSSTRVSREDRAAYPGDARGQGCRRRETRRRARFHLQDARRLRHGCRGARRFALGRTAPAPCHRPGARRRPAHPDFRRSHLRARLRVREHHSEEHAQDRGRPHGVHRGSPAFRRSHRRPDSHHRGRRGDGGRLPRRPRQGERALCNAASPAIGRRRRERERCRPRKLKLSKAASPAAKEPSPSAHRTRISCARARNRRNAALAVGRAVTYTIIAITLSGLGWSIVGHVDIVAVASGKIVTRSHTKIVGRIETASVKAILVRPGEHVMAGQPLIELEKVTAQAEEGKARQDLIAATLDVLRLRAFLSGGAFDASDATGASAAQLADAEARLLSQKEEAAAKLASLVRERESKDGERETLVRTMTKLKSILPIVTEKAQIRQKSADTAFGSRFRKP